MAGSHPPCFRLTGAPSPAGVRSPRPLGWPPCSPSNCPVDTLQFWVEIQRLREALSPGPRVYPGLATCPFSSSRCLHWVLVPSLLLACPPHSPYPFGPKRERRYYRQQPHRITMETEDGGTRTPDPGMPCHFCPLLCTEPRREASELLCGPRGTPGGSPAHCARDTAGQVWPWQSP